MFQQAFLAFVERLAQRHITENLKNSPTFHRFVQATHDKADELLQSRGASLVDDLKKSGERLGSGLDNVSTRVRSSVTQFQRDFEEEYNRQKEADAQRRRR
ncbi:hypothetical protein CAOG_07563 [Capsaspora owczarzaki ATCC 30864]|uniref:Uncharacterized protein n=1 Tax=Capsaspora owczarzaki (strain ATCC 30864) TaxID=595528 RepID=A0A0D2VZ82_CAPO3|nr:hypothetical protein CAOG_07563 [Capsaspora owczarzaki ATCC 30864]KJE97092.1 hypothetical protein CAOG_007563 [Capsaspora owczarzaki ATCC 30864]|eukprot:XP_004343437.1 hypothetical protein CAOG_07563 [Capsaspora owczarzaki ATCC 30864]